MGSSSKSTAARITGCWLPIFAFFALGFEHCVVNMFVIPMGIMLGAKITLADWWYWNQVPVTLGNIVRRVSLTGCPLLDLPPPRLNLPVRSLVRVSLTRLSRSVGSVCAIMNRRINKGFTNSNASVRLCRYRCRYRVHSVAKRTVIIVA